MASKAKQPETVKMKAGWGDVREVIPEMVGVLESQGWVIVENTVTKQEQDDETGKLG